MMKLQSVVCAALLLSLLAPGPVLAQTLPAAKLPAVKSPVMKTQATAGGFEVSCPPTLTLTVTQVGRLPFDIKGLDIRGFQQKFVPTTVRLIDPDVAPVADAKNEVQSGTPDDLDMRKPGVPIAYTIWGQEEKAPSWAAAVTCRYEGGYTLQRAIPAGTRACNMRVISAKAPAAETSTRIIYSSAVFSCR